MQVFTLNLFTESLKGNIVLRCAVSVYLGFEVITQAAGVGKIITPFPVLSSYRNN